MTALTLALSKGRILDDCLPLLRAAGVAPLGDAGRLLRIPTEDANVELLEIRPTDVPTYGEYGAADLGVVGKDILLEHGGGALYEPLDLGLAVCRLSIATTKDSPLAQGRALQQSTRRLRIPEAHEPDRMHAGRREGAGADRRAHCRCRRLAGACGECARSGLTSVGT
ncbi:MAG: hypothetical protein NVS9B10_25910 [Nevskia sp.]